MKLRQVVFTLSLLFASSTYAQQNDATTTKVSAYLEGIRDKGSALTAFFQAMPKGGDLHHHFSGSVYAEEMYEVARDSGFYVDLGSFTIYTHPVDSTSVVKIKDYRGPIQVRENLINLWSVKDFVAGIDAPDDHFFNTFGQFGPTIGGNEAMFLKAIKSRSIKENVQYIETMLVRPNFDRGNQAVREYLTTYDATLFRLQSARDARATQALFEQMYQRLTTQLNFAQYANGFTQYVRSIESASRLPLAEDTNIVIRYLNYVTRVNQPADVFAQLLLSFMTVDNKQILGVNIVAPEDNPTSMRDYWLHMQMFAFFRAKYPAVMTTLHAGELRLGLVKPEELTWHINDAVKIAGAKRIGHGVDLAHEHDMPGLLTYMKDSSVAIEINLTSNEFILGIKNEQHPFPLYFKYGVPIVISTDDAGVLRSNHTDQFVLLANRYKQVKYADIKRFVYNSINYSFLPASDKSMLRARLDAKFKMFERDVVTRMK